jgi:hypothetical protein
VKAPDEIIVSFNAEHLKIAQQLVRSLTHAIKEASPEAVVKRIEDLREQFHWSIDQHNRIVSVYDAKIKKLEADLKEANDRVQALTALEAEKAIEYKQLAWMKSMGNGNEKALHQQLVSLKAKLEACEKELEFKTSSLTQARATVEQFLKDTASWNFDRRTAEAALDNEKVLRERDKNTFEAKLMTWQTSMRNIREAMGVPEAADAVEYGKTLNKAIDLLCCHWMRKGRCDQCPCFDTCDAKPIKIHQTHNPELCVKILRAWAMNGGKK